MINLEIVRRQQRLESLFDRISLATYGDMEMQAHWSRYLCILCAGFIENAVPALYGDFATRAASEPVARYTLLVLRKTQNPKSSKIVEISRAFKENWGVQLEEYMGDEGRREAIDSIMNNRNQIAHGENSNISFIRLREWYGKSLEVLEYIEQQCST